MRTVVFVVWLILRIINGVVLACRVTPFTGPDLKLITESLRILNKYLSFAILIIVLALLVLLICGPRLA